MSINQLLFAKVHQCALMQNMKTHAGKSSLHPRIHVLLSDEDAARFEAYCRTKGFKKSTLVARLIREHLDREHFAEQRELFGHHAGSAGAA